MIPKGLAGQRHEVMAAEVLHVTGYGMSPEVQEQVLTGLPCLRCPSLGTGFIVAIVIIGKVGLGQTVQ